MPLKVDPNLKYQCVQCGRSCTGWNVWLKPELAARLKELPITLRVIEKQQQAFEQEPDGRIRMYRPNIKDPCGFLTEQKLCAIHSELGYQHKPAGCRQFPFLLTELPQNELRVSASFCCTAVRTEQGPPLADNLAEIEELVQQGAVIKTAEPVLRPAEPPVPWPEIQAHEREIEIQAQQLGWQAALEQAILKISQSTALPLIAQVMPMSLLKPCLYDTDRELWQRIDQGFLGQIPLEIPEFNWNGPVADLQLILDQYTSQFDRAIDQYRQALWFRKAHLLTGSLLSGLLLLHSLPGILKLLAALHAWKNEREPQLSDFHSALDDVEMSLVAHSENGALVVEQMSHHLVAMAQ